VKTERGEGGGGELKENMKKACLPWEKIISQFLMSEDEPIYLTLSQ